MNSESIKQKKQQLRKELRANMRALSREERSAEDRLICEQAMALPEYIKAQTIMVYVGMDWEVDTMPILEDILAGQKTLVLPLCLEPGIMEGRVITSLDELVTGAYGIPEPGDKTRACRPENIDLGIIPCVACDERKRRLGQGGGYYDRFTEDHAFTTAAICRKSAFMPAEPGVPAEPWDLTADIVILSDRVVR